MFSFCVFRCAVFLYIFFHALKQNNLQAECTGACECENHTDSWMTIILFTGMTIIPNIHTISSMKIIP